MFSRVLPLNTLSDRLYSCVVAKHASAQRSCKRATNQMQRLRYLTGETFRSSSQ